MGGYCEGCGHTDECVCDELLKKSVCGVLLKKSLKAQCDCQGGWICPKCADEIRQLKHDLRKLVEEMEDVGEEAETWWSYRLKQILNGGE